MGNAMAVLVGRAMEGFSGGDFRAGFKVKNLLPAQRSIKGIGTMDADAGFGRVPVTVGTGYELQSGGRCEQFKRVMGIVKLRRRGGEDELETFVGGNDRQQSVHEFAQIADESDFVQQHRSRPRTRRSDVGRDDFGAGVAGGRVINAEFQTLLRKQLSKTRGGNVFGARAPSTDNFFVRGGVEGFKFNFRNVLGRGQKNGGFTKFSPKA